MGDNISLFFLESCTNPSGQMFDFNIMEQLLYFAPNCLFCVDNTWCTGYGFNPFPLHIDFVVESATKYISAGKCIGGIILGKRSNKVDIIMDDIDEWIRIYGQFVGKDHCHIFRMGIKTMKHRLEYISKKSLKLAKYLENNDNVNRVMFPTLKSHPTFKVSTQFLKLHPGCIWFHVNHDKSNDQIKKLVLKLAASQNDILFETSYGSKYCKIDPWPENKRSNAYDIEQQNIGKKGIWFRLSVGYEFDIKTTILQLEKMLEYFKFQQ